MAMRTIMILNAKGGCGKSTLATNIASYFASQDKKVVIADYDPQASSLAWLQARPEHLPEIGGINAVDEAMRVNRNTDILILDVPAGIRGKDLTAVMRRVQTIIIPVLPSPIDIRAAAGFIHDLLTSGRVCRKQVKLAVVANRVRENTTIFHTLDAFLKRLSIPFIATLRDTQNYIKAADQGIGLFEMAPSQVYRDLEQWGPLIRWIKSKRSLP